MWQKYTLRAQARQTFAVLRTKVLHEVTAALQRLALARYFAASRTAEH
jgi:hypothetical protein